MAPPSWPHYEAWRSLGNPGLFTGLLVLESSSNTDASEIGFFALAFIAGFNVDKFVAKIEEVAKAVWGIDKSRSSQARTEEHLKNSSGGIPSLSEKASDKR
jgi:hypothetical protein